MQAPQPSRRSAHYLLTESLSRFAALWRRSSAFKGILVVAAGLALLPVAALSLRPAGGRQGPAVPPSVAPSVTGPALETVTVDQLPVAAAPSAGRAGKSLTASRASAAPGAGTGPGAARPTDKTATGYVVAQGMTVPLPPGQWVVVAHVPAPEPGGIESLFLAQMRRDKLSRAVLVQARAQVDDSATGFQRSAQ